MLPTAYEFHWDIGHIMFLGIFYGVITVVLTTLGCAAFHWLKDLNKRQAGIIEWEEAFEDLPADRRHCRYEFDGTVASRICENGFDCAHCERHRELVAGKDQPSPDVSFRLFHRGHTWVHPNADGTVTVGLDGFARRLFGRIDRVILPDPGQELVLGDRSVTLEKGDLRARISTPISGTVIERGKPGDYWLYKLQPSGVLAETENLLQGREAEIWMMREREWLHRVLTPVGETTVYADGGILMPDLVKAYPDADWEDIWAQVVLQV